MSAAGAQAMFWAFLRREWALSLASVFLVFTGTSIARTFFIAATMFGAMSLYGYTTKRDLTQFSSFLIMGLIGVIIAAVVNLFLGSTALQFAISVIGIFVFLGLTAWDTQTIKEQYAENIDQESRQKMAVWGAFSLYLNFINIFQLFAALHGRTRNRLHRIGSQKEGSDHGQKRPAGHRRTFRQARRSGTPVPAPRCRLGDLHPRAHRSTAWGAPITWRRPSFVQEQALEAAQARIEQLEAPSRAGAGAVRGTFRRPVRRQPPAPARSGSVPRVSASQRPSRGASVRPAWRRAASWQVPPRPLWASPVAFCLPTW